MLFETGKSRRRLYRSGDPVHALRRAGRTTPSRSSLPPRYHALLDWYEKEWNSVDEGDPLLALRGSWKTLLGGKSADDYVRELREGWDE